MRNNAGSRISYCKRSFGMNRSVEMFFSEFRLSGYFESLKKNNDDSISSTIMPEMNSYEQELLDTINQPQTIISSRASEETASELEIQ